MNKKPITIKEYTCNELSESHIDEMKIGDIIRTGIIKLDIRRFITNQPKKKFIIQNIDVEEYIILRVNDSIETSSIFKYMKIGEHVDIKENAQKLAKYCHVYGAACSKKFKSETFNTPHDGKFTRITRIK